MYTLVSTFYFSFSLLQVYKYFFLLSNYYFRVIKLKFKLDPGQSGGSGCSHIWYTTAPVTPALNPDCAAGPGLLLVGAVEAFSASGVVAAGTLGSVGTGFLAHR